MKTSPIYETKSAKQAIKSGHKMACRELDLRATSSIPKSDPNHPMYSVAA